MKEKLLKALNSSDLEDDTWETHVQVVASLGAAQGLNVPNASQKRKMELMLGLNVVKPKKHISIGAMLLHIRSGQYRFLPHVKKIMVDMVNAKAKRDRWKGVTKDRAESLVGIALDYYFRPHCPVCNGVGKIGELGKVIVLCSTADGGCGGTGRRAARWKGWMEHTRDVLSMLERYEGYANHGTRRQSRG